MYETINRLLKYMQNATYINTKPINVIGDISIGVNACNDHVSPPNKSKNNGLAIQNPRYEKFLNKLNINRWVIMPKISSVKIHRIMLMIKFLFS